MTPLASAARALGAASETPRLDAELLMAHALGITRNDLLLRGEPAEPPPGFVALVDRRLAGEPIAYIVGRRAFWTIDLAVGPGALIPRPDSETLIEAAVAHFGKAGPRTVLDLGTGPGTLLLAALAEWPGATGLGIDASPRALAYAERNAREFGMQERARFRIGDWADEIDERFDLVLCNPPYIEADAALPPDVAVHEPHSALFAGPDGLDDYRRIAPVMARLIASGGIAAIETGWQQAAAAGALFAAEGLVPEVRRDLGGRDRCLVLHG